MSDRDDIRDRKRILQITPDVIMSFIAQFAEDLPYDIQYHSAHYDPQYDVFLVKVQSSRFSPVIQGEEIPCIHPTLADTPKCWCGRRKSPSLCPVCDNDE